MIMAQPRDYSSHTTVGAIRVARVFSNIVSPPVIFATLGLVLALDELPFWQGLLWAAIFGFWVSLVPILFVANLLRKGQITDLHMNTTRERRSPYIVSVIGAIVAYLFIVLFGGPNLLKCLAVTTIVSLAILAIVTNFWMISIHATSMTAATVIVYLVFGPLFGLLLVPLLLLVSWVRIYLKRHNLAQIMAGIFVGGITALAIFTLGCPT